MKEIVDLISNPLVWKILIGYWVFSALVGALPAPNGEPPLNKWWYKFLFTFLHSLGGNLNRAAMSFKVPGAIEDK